MSADLRLKFIIEAVDRATANVAKVNARIDKITEPVRKVRASFNSLVREAHLPKIGAAARNVSQRFDGVISSLRGIATGLFVVGGAAAAAWIPLRRTVDAAGRINDQAAMAGVSAREFQRLAFAFELDGVNAELAAKSITDLQRRAAEAASGNEEMAKWFNRAGMDADFLRKNLGQPAVLVNALADGIARLPTAGQRAAVMQALMSEGGVKLAQTFARGSAEINRLGDEAERLGDVLDGKTIGAMDEAGDTLTRMERALGGVWKRIVVTALPAIERVSKRVIEWSVANRELIATRVAEFIDRFMERLPEILATIGRIAVAIGVLVGMADRVAQFFGGWENVLAGIAAVMVGKFLVAVALLMKALGALTLVVAKFGIVLLATPLGWIIAGITAIAGLAYLLIKNWEPVKQFFSDLWEGIKQGILQLDAITPEWVKRFTIPGQMLAGAANAVRPAAPSALGAPGGGATDVGGTIRVAIDQDGRARVTEMKSNNRAVDFDVDAGLMFGVP